MLVPRRKTNGALPNFAVFGGTEEGLTRLLAGFVVAVSHPCNASRLRRGNSGPFQPIDTARLSNWHDLIPGLAGLEGKAAPRVEGLDGPLRLGSDLDHLPHRSVRGGGRGRQGHAVGPAAMPGGWGRSPRAETPGGSARSGRASISARSPPTGPATGSPR